MAINGVGQPSPRTVPTVDSVDNTDWGDVIGNKEDGASETADESSVVALSRQSLADIATVDALINTALVNIAAIDVLVNTTLTNVAIVDALVRETLAEAQEIERHVHNYERWFGPAAVPAGENHVADPLGEVGGTPPGVVTSFTLTSGANKTWGAAVQILGATDCAVVLPTDRQAFFDLHRLLPTGTSEDKDDWLLRIICGTSAAAGVAADTYGVIPLFIENADKVQQPVELITEYHGAGTKMWVQLLHVDDNNVRTVDLQFAIHGYPA